MTLRRNMAHSLAGFAVPAIVTFAAYRLLVTKLGLDMAGVVVLASTLSGLFAFVGIGFTEATVHFVARSASRGDSASTRLHLSTSLRFYLCVGAVVGTMVLLGARPYVNTLGLQDAEAEEAATVFHLAAALVVLSFLVSTLTSFFKGLSDFRTASLITVWLSAASFGVGSALVAFFNIGATGFMAVLLAANMGAIGLVGRRAARHCDCSIFELIMQPGSALSEMLRFGGIIAITGVSAAIYFQAQRYIAGVLGGAEAAAVTALAMAATSKAHALNRALSEVLFPLVSAGTDVRKARHAYRLALVGGGSVAAVVLIPTAVWAEQVSALWLGASAGEQLAPYLRIYAIAYIFLALSPAPYYVLNGLGRPALNSANVVLRLTTNSVAVAALAVDGVSAMDLAVAFTVATVVVDGFAWPALVESILAKRVKST